MLQRISRGQPSRAQVASLNPMERLSYRVGALINETPAGKWAASAYLTVFSQHWMRFFIHAVTQIEGLEHVPKDRSYILAANHRTFWDFYSAMCELWGHMPKGHKPYLYCPVRSEFFYDRVVGGVVNLAVSGYSMYPPIFRDSRGSQLNDLAVQKCVDVLRFSPRTVLAIHPEGKRNRSDDPYALLPPKPGIGRIALAAPEVPVIPVLLTGLSNDLKRIVAHRKRPDRSLIRIHFGPPVDLHDLHSHSAEPAAHKAASERVMQHIAALIPHDRAVRQAWAKQHGAPAAAATTW